MVTLIICQGQLTILHAPIKSLCYWVVSTHMSLKGHQGAHFFQLEILLHLYAYIPHLETLQWFVYTSFSSLPYLYPNPWSICILSDAIFTFRILPLWISQSWNFQLSEKWPVVCEIWKLKGPSRHLQAVFKFIYFRVKTSNYKKLYKNKILKGIIFWRIINLF